MDEFSHLKKTLAEIIELLGGPGIGQGPKTFTNEYQLSLINKSPDYKINLIKNLSKQQTQESAKKIALIIETFYTHLDRSNYIHHIGFSLMNLECLDGIASFLKQNIVLEVGAGSGLLTYLLKYYTGLNIEASDIIGSEDIPENMIKFVHVKKLDITKDSYEADALLLSWPEHYLVGMMDNLPDCVNKIVIIGEDEGDATDALIDRDGGVVVYDFRKNKTYKKVYPFRSVDNDLELPVFQYIHDRIHFYERI